MEYDGMTFYPAIGDAMGESVVKRWADHFRADIVVSVTDHWIWKTDIWKSFRWVPICFPDHKPLGLTMIRNVKMAQRAVIPTKWGEKIIRDEGIKQTEYIPLGIETDIFKPDEAARKAQRAIIISTAKRQGATYLTDDCFIFGMVARNGTYPIRKGHDLVMDAAAQLLRRGQKNFLIYMHSMADGAHNGVDLIRMLNAYARAYQDDRLNRHILFPPPEQMHLGTQDLGFPDQRLAALYNAMDCFVNPSQWEGFGLTGLEAAGCGVPSIVTDVGCQPEIAPVGWTVPVHRRLYAPATDTFVAEPDLDGLVNAMEAALSGARQSELRDKAVRHARKYDWDDIVEKKWLPFLEELEGTIKSGKKELIAV
jgi:glycosyltransferase involved in cell wall biosynthesis